ncbi:MAG: DUF424 family protein [Candidatus Woesearchaeota archaeon]|nr:DUF424 family protein [Candidatus Woesearchaeota archaeon]
MILKIHRAEGKSIIALSDDSLAGKKFEENGLQLDLSADFYRGEKATEQEIIDAAGKAYTVNIVGKESISFAVKKGMIEKGRVREIAGIPYAYCLIMRED